MFVSMERGKQLAIKTFVHLITSFAKNDPTQATFNTCDDADNVTNTGCSGADAFSDTRDEYGPLIHLLVYKEDDSGSRTCSSGSPYLVTFHYSDPDADAYSMMNADAYSDILWNRGDDNLGVRTSTNARVWHRLNNGNG